MALIPVPCPCGGDGGGPAVEGCCSASLSTSVLCLPDGSPILVVTRSGCADCGTAPADPEVAGWIDPSTGTFTAGAPPADAGPCQAGDCASVSLLRLCDQTPDDCVPFLRHLVHDCDGQVTTSADTATDGTTPYTVQGEAIDCSECPCQDGTKTLPLCDYQPDGSSIPFLRRVTYDCETGQVTDQTDTTLDNTTPYTPVGEVGECGQCRPAPMCPQLLGLSGPETWSMPDGTESLAVTVACGPVTITDCAGNTTQINECGASFTWSAPPTDCAPGRLCSPLTVDVPEGAAVYLNLLTPCDLGDVS